MTPDKNRAMPAGYEFLDSPLSRAQEHVFLINDEIEKLDGNSVYERELVRLQEERQAVISSIKHEFELRTWEIDAAKFQEVDKVVDARFSDEAYRQAKNDLIKSGKDYRTSNYWQDTLERNLEYYKSQELVQTAPEQEKSFDSQYELNYYDWQPKWPDKTVELDDIDSREIDLDLD